MGQVLKSLGKEYLALLVSDSDASSPPPAQERYGRWSDNLVENGCTPDKQRETNNLQPFEGLPTESEAYDPDE